MLRRITKEKTIYDTYLQHESQCDDTIYNKRINLGQMVLERVISTKYQ